MSTYKLHYFIYMIRQWRFAKKRDGNITTGTGSIELYSIN